MGYRSDVALAMAQKDWVEFCRLSAVSGCFGTETVANYFDFVEPRDDGYVIAGADGVNKMPEGVPFIHVEEEFGRK